MSPEISSEHTETEPSSWRLWRQDIHGNQYRMPTNYESEQAATEAYKTYTAKGHHQTYFIKPLLDGDELDFIPASE